MVKDNWNLKSPEVQLTIEIEYLQRTAKKQEDVARRKAVKEEEEGSENSSTKSVNSGSGPYYQIFITLG
jgi:ribosomal protein S6